MGKRHGIKHGCLRKSRGLEVKVGFWRPKKEVAKNDTKQISIASIMRAQTVETNVH